MPIRNLVHICCLIVIGGNLSILYLKIYNFSDNKFYLDSDDKEYVKDKKKVGCPSSFQRKICN